MKYSKKKHAPGEIRQSQLLFLSGPGAMIDLPNQSVVVGGLDHWLGEKKLVREERLASYIRNFFDLEEISMYAPPVEDPQSNELTGITTFLFPLWFVAQIKEEDIELDAFKKDKNIRRRPLVHWNQLVKGQYLTYRRKKRPVVPIRFVQACPNGHLSDIDWVGFVHHYEHHSCQNAQLWLEENNSAWDISQSYVYCEKCKKRRSLYDMKIKEGAVLGYCGGERPWLGKGNRERCINPNTGKPHRNQLLIRSASNTYFPQVLTVISIPEPEQPLRKAVDRVYEDFLQYAESLEELTRERKKKKVAVAIADFSDEEVWNELKRRRENKEEDPDEQHLKEAEIQTLLSSPIDEGEDIPEGDFYARTRPSKFIDPQFKEKIDSIILVHRLREVRALLGFTRFEGMPTTIEGELDVNVGMAALADNISWVPAIENRGEGIFISFRKEAVERWLKKESVRKRAKTLEEGFQIWNQKQFHPKEFPGAAYIMLHSLSHLLITAVALDSGYSASAIRERVYAGHYGYGILLYTGSSGSEGTLGGLVQIGNKIEYYLSIALERGKLCSNDPICAQHNPSRNPHEERFLHGAACHGCLLIAETSCENRNSFLDRALVINTVDNKNAAFFEN